ncbi:DUF6542 domain-containing protein [Yinghuangia seranimata]|uniref:DUF6542 domain-containing protein n=1 Tax=Yinghuangia seranimata TaxID=408067 RepID=UPI00248BBB41|nr:DUF6542 domain-containing protein [Yinghuangia seranimata]MDI2128887.1 hypothetical protein [Yinghuangia seranimata]
MRRRRSAASPDQPDDPGTPPSGGPPPPAAPPVTPTGTGSEAGPGTPRPRPAPPGGPGTPQGRRPHPPRRGPAGNTGLTAPGAFVVATGGTLLGGLVNEIATDTIGVIFGTAFFASCVLVAVKTRTRDLVAAAIAPPLAFALTIVALSLVFPSDNGEPFLVRMGLDVFTALTFKAGVLWGGSALAAAIAFVRYRADQQRTRRPPRPTRDPRPPRAPRPPDQRAR